MNKITNLLFFTWLIVMLIFINGTALDYSTSSEISMRRVFSDTTIAPGENVTVKLSVNFGSISDDARGLYITDNIPDTLVSSLTTISVELGGIELSGSVTIEQDSSGSIYHATTPVRWIFETPPWFTENIPVNANDSVVVKYTVSIPANMPDSTVFSFPNAIWVAVIDPQGTASYEFGYEDFPNPTLMVLITPPTTRAEIDTKIRLLKEGEATAIDVRNLIDRYMHGR
jgi:hypothetical protein